MPTEIERKFLIADPPEWLNECRSESIEQGYLALGEHHEEVRLRRGEGPARLTVKRGHGEERLEQEVEISDEQLDALWPLTEGRRVAKQRHYVEGAPTLEVDVYSGELKGLVTAEAEFPSLKAAERFSAPDWLGRELTGDDRYANQELATRGLPGD